MVLKPEISKRSVYIMKYCPFCGAPLIGGALFCSECGSSLQNLPAIDTQDKIHAGTGPLPSSSTSNQAYNATELKTKPKTSKSRQSQPLKKKKTSTPPQSNPPVTDPSLPDDGYDGYYDDVKPLDNGHDRERMDPELVKRICMVAGGAVLVIIFSVVMMLLL